MSEKNVIIKTDVKLVNARWLYCVECPQYNTRLEELVYLCDCDCLEGKRENYQVCSVQYCVQQLCTLQCTHI